MTLDLEDLRLAVYRSLATPGARPTPRRWRPCSRQPRRDRGRPPGTRRRAAPRAGRGRAGRARASLLDGRPRVLGEGQHTLWWGGCIWDSFAIPHLVPDEPEVLVATTCQGCGRAHAWVVGGRRPPMATSSRTSSSRRAHVGRCRPLCANQRVFCDDGASTHGSPEKGRSAATQPTSRRCGDSPAAGTRAGSTAATSGGSRPWRMPTCARRDSPGRSGGSDRPSARARSPFRRSETMLVSRSQPTGCPRAVALEGDVGVRTGVRQWFDPVPEAKVERTSESLTRIGRAGSRQPSWTSSAIPTTTRSLTPIPIRTRSSVGHDVAPRTNPVGRKPRQVDRLAWYATA